MLLTLKAQDPKTSKKNTSNTPKKDALNTESPRPKLPETQPETVSSNSKPETPVRPSKVRNPTLRSKLPKS